MLQKILAISGKAGLFKLVSQGKNIIVAETLTDHKRIPVYQTNNVMSLNDIRIYTDTGEATLSQIFSAIKEKENGKQIAFNSTAKPGELQQYFAEILPDFDRKRVYVSAIKKVLSWYNQLINAGFTDFEKKEATEETNAASTEE